LKAGRKHLIRKEHEAALADYNRAIQIAPHLGEAYRGRGCVYQAMGDREHALADFDRAIQSDPRLVPAYLERAKIRTQNGDYDGALGDFGVMLAIGGNDSELYLNRGICLMKKGQVSEAISDFQRVLKLTNHSDFAEPAKKYLQQLGGPLEAPEPQRLPAANPNGASAAPPMPEPKAEDYVL
jgi:tetratricopeptide (TPR) repeat protein